MKSRRRIAVTVTLILMGTGLLLAPVPLSRLEPDERTIRIEASSFAFNPGTVRVNEGDRVTIELVAEDVVHGLYIDGYDLSVTADPGQTARLSFVADRPGSFRFRCSVTCGALHPFMVGKLKVGRNWLLWRAVGLVFVGALAGVLLRWE
jgi:plastocyanin